SLRGANRGNGAPTSPASPLSQRSRGRSFVITEAAGRHQEGPCGNSSPRVRGRRQSSLSGGWICLPDDRAKLGAGRVRVPGACSRVIAHSRVIHSFPVRPRPQFREAVFYFPTIRMVNEPAIMGPRAGRHAGLGCASAGGGPNSAVMVSTWFVFVSRARVLAHGMVVSVCSTAKLVGLFSLMNVMVPPPSALIASIVAELNATVSTPSPVGKVVRMLPLSAFKITTVGEGWR